MILRSMRLRHGRIALPKPSTPAPIRSCRRHASSIERREQPEFTQPAPERPKVAAFGSRRVVQVNDPNHPVAQDYLFFQHQKERTSELGVKATPHYKPHELVSNPPWPRDISLELLMASQAHLGHATSLWNPANAAYIFGVRGDHDPIHIISLDATAAYLRRACKIVSGVTERGGLVLFVGTREQQSSAVVRAAQLAKGCHLFTKWIPGSITNGQQILGKCAKKVVNEFDEEVPGFEEQLETKAVIKPDLVVCLNPLENYVLLHECGLNNIPSIGIIDTDATPTWVTYPIPANDDSLRCVQLIAGVLGRAGQEGQQKRLALAKEGVVTYAQTHDLDPPSRVARTNTSRRQQAQTAPTTPLPAEPSIAGAGHAGVTDIGGADSFDPANDLAGVPVDQFAADEKLLNDAERAALFDEDAADLDIAAEAYGDDENFADGLDDSPLASAEVAQAAQDLDAQFSFQDEDARLQIDQFENDADKDQSTRDQVEAVDEELNAEVQESDLPAIGTQEQGLGREPLSDGTAVPAEPPVDADPSARKR